MLLLLAQSHLQYSSYNFVVAVADLLNVNCGEVNNNNNNNNSSSSSSQQTQTQTTASTSRKDARSQAQPAVGVAAVAACKVCQPQFLQPQQRSQQPWPGVTAQAVATGSSSRHRYVTTQDG